MVRKSWVKSQRYRGGVCTKFAGSVPIIQIIIRTTGANNPMTNQTVAAMIMIKA